METGNSIQAYQEAHGFKPERYKVLFIGTHWSREALYERINQRVMAMIQEGLIEEAESLLWRGYSSDLQALKSIGYKQAFAFLDEQIGMEEMVFDIQQKSRHYAKKQLTWYKHNPEVNWLEGNRISESDIQLVQRFLDAS